MSRQTYQEVRKESASSNKKELNSRTSSAISESNR